MAFTLAYPPGFVDIPDSQLASGNYVTGPALSAIKSNADFSPVVYETFVVGPFLSGATVPLPFSPADNYLYSREECKYSWEVVNTTNNTTGLPSGQGGLLGGTWNVDQATGIVSCFEVYQIEGGASTDTQDGALMVTIHAVRGINLRSMAEQASYQVILESEFSQDQALDTNTITQVSKNAKAATVSVEPILMNPSGAPTWSPEANITAGQLIQPTSRWANGCWYVAANSGLTGTTEPAPWPSNPGYQAGITDGAVIWNLAGWGFMHGQQIPYPQSPIDGYQYSSADTFIPIPFHASTFSLPRQTGITQSFTSGEGNIRAISKGVTLTQPAASTNTPIGSTAPVKRNTSVINTAKTIYPGMSDPPSGMQNMSANLSPGAATTGVGILNCSVAYENGTFDDGTCHVMVICIRSFVKNIPSGEGALFTDFPTTDVLTGGTPNVTILSNIVRNLHFGALRPEIFVNTVTPGSAPPIPQSSTGYQYSQAELTYIWYWTNTGAGAGRLRDFVIGVNQQNGTVDTRTDYFLGDYKGGYGNICSALYGFPGAPIRSQMPDGSSGIPTVVVITFARRSHENEIQPLLMVSSPVTGQPAPPSQNNLIPNPGFENWSRMNLQAVAIVGVADDWYIGQNSGTTAFLQETGLVGRFAQGIGVQCSGSSLTYRATASNWGTASDLCDMVEIAPGGLYSCGVMTKASPNNINYGFYYRIHVLDINGQNDTYFDLTGDVTQHAGSAGTGCNTGGQIPTGGQNYAFTFTMPTNGSTSVSTSSGQAVLSQNITFTPAYAYVELLLEAVTYSGYTGGNLVLFAIYDQAYFVYVKEAAAFLGPGGLPATINAWDSSLSYSVGQPVTWEGGLYVCQQATTPGIAPSNSTYWFAIGTTTWEGPWSATETYAIGQMVSDNSSAWICTAVPPVGTAPATGSSYWTPMGIASDYQGAWSNGQQYTAGQEVSANDAYGNPQVWICLATSTNNPPSSSPAYWSLLSNISYQGAWSSTATYQPANQVAYQGNVWLALKAVPAGTTPGTNGNYWLQMGSSAAVILSITGNSPILPWSPTYQYFAGDEASYGGSFYRALEDSANQEPDTATTYWQIIGGTPTPASPLGPWNSTVTYNSGDEVTYAPVQAASSTSAATAPGTVTDHSRQTAWTNPSNAAGTSSFATCSLGNTNSTHTSDLLQFTNFGFSIPAGSQITGISVSVQRDQTSGSSATYDDLVTLLGVTGSPVNHIKPYPQNAWPGAAATETYGGDKDLWGVMPTVAQVNSSGFGFEIGCECTQSPGSGAAIELNSAKMTVYYVPPASGQGTSNIYQSLAAGNLGNEPDTNPNWWALKGPATVDAVTDGQSYQRTPTYSSNENLVQNPTFLSGTMAGWLAAGGGTAQIVTDTLPSGQSGPCIKLSVTTEFQELYSNTWGYTPGATYYYSAWVKTGGHASWFWYGGPNNTLQQGIGSPTSWTFISGEWTISASSPNTLTGYLEFIHFNSGVADWIEVWGASVVKLRNLDTEIQEGATYQRTLATALTSGQVDLSKAGVIQKHLGNIADTTGRYAVTNAGGMAGVSAVDSANRALINLASSGHQNTNLGYIGDDSTSGRFASANNTAAQPAEPYNGGFEISNSIDSTNGAPPGWTPNYETSGSGYRVWITHSVVHSGNSAIAIQNGSGGMTCASEAIPVLGNARYTLSCWMNSQVANPGTGYLRVCWYSSTADLSVSGRTAEGNIVQGGGPTAANTWQQFSAQVVAPSNAIAARIEIGTWVGTNGYICFDDVHFQPSALNLADGVIGNATADYIGQGATFMIPTAARINAATDSSGNLLLKNIAQPASTNATTSSTSSVAISGVSASITTKGNKVLVILTGSWWIETGSGVGSVVIARDGTQISGTGEVGVTSAMFGSMSYIDSPSASTHTYAAYWKTSGGTLRGDYIYIQAIELG